MSDCRNIGIASKMIDLLLEEVKKQNKILLRTAPDDLGKLYIFNQITDKIKKNDIDHIPHNLAIVFSILENKCFCKKKLNNKEKINQMNLLSNESLKHAICKKYNIDTIDKLNLNFMKEIEETFNLLNKNKKKLKIKKN
jgi:hypothetical protein